MKEERHSLEGINYFHIDQIAREYQLDLTIARRLLDEARQEFENDEMMAELHTIRAIKRMATTKQQETMTTPRIQYESFCPI